jgi:hypothetical protein
MKPTYTATGRYYVVYQDGERISQHTTEREACEVSGGIKLENPDAAVNYQHEYVVEVGLAQLSQQTEYFDLGVGITL